MSEALPETMESEAWPEGFESEGESEATSEAFASEASSEGSWPEASGDDARRRRQRQIMLARRQAQVRPAARPPAPAPPRAVPATTTQAVRAANQAVRAVSDDVLALDLDTKAAMRRIRRELDEANRMGYRNAIVAEASIAASQALDSFHEDLKPHDWARALIRVAPTVAIATKRKKPGFEGILLDPRLFGSAVIASLFLVGHFRNQSHGVTTVQVTYTGPLTAAAGENHTAQLTAIALDKAGNSVPDASYTYQPTTAGFFSISESNPGVVTLTGVAAGTTWLTVSSAGKSDGVWVTVT
jgi:hypothetical protein